MSDKDKAVAMHRLAATLLQAAIPQAQVGAASITTDPASGVTVMVVGDGCLDDALVQMVAVHIRSHRAKYAAAPGLLH